MPVQLYGTRLSPPTRNVIVTLEALKIPYELKVTEPLKGETKTPEFLKMNPQHNIPVLKDGDYILNESRAIMIYLAEKYGKNSKLYPDDPKIRGRVNQRLHFDMGSFFKSFADCAGPVLFAKTKPTEEQLNKLRQNFQWLNDFIRPTGFVAGTTYPTLADLAFVVSFSTSAPTGIIDHAVYPELKAWYDRVTMTIPNYEQANKEGAGEFHSWFKSKFAEIA